MQISQNWILIMPSGKMQGQLYSYPAFRWRKKKRCNLFPVACIPKSNDIDMSETGNFKYNCHQKYCVLYYIFIYFSNTKNSSNFIISSI